MKPRDLVARIRRLGVNLGFLVFMLVFVAGIAASTAYTVHRLRAETITHYLMVASMHARAIEDHLTQSFSIVDQTLANASHASEEDLTPAQLSRHLEAALQISPALRSISVLDADNRIIASTNPVNLGVEVDSKDYLPPPSGNNELPRIGRPWSGRDFGNGTPNDVKPVPENRGLSFIPVVRSVRLGRRTLTLATAVNPDYFVSHYSAQLRPDEGFVEVLRYDGAGMLSTGDRPIPETMPPDRTFMAQLSDKEFGSFEEALPDDASVITAFRASRQFPLVVVAHIDRNQALAEWAAETRRLVLTVLPALLAVVVLTTLLYIYLRRVEEHRAELRQHEHDKLAATVFQTVDGGVLVTDADINIIAVNPAFTNITGFSRDEVIGKTPRSLVADKHPAEFFVAMSTTLADTGNWHGEIWSRHKNGQLYVAWLSIKQVRNEHGELTHYVGAFSDITERKAADERIRYLAHHDALTGLPNRTLFFDRLEQALAKARRDKTSNPRLALMYIDLDRFKPVNDTLGHAVGDMLLQQVAARMQACVRESDTVARLGGDEFALLLPSIEEANDALLVAEKIRQALCLPFDLSGHSVSISCSIGIAVVPEHGHSETQLTKCADDAMYRAKAAGRNKAELLLPRLTSGTRS